MGTTNFVDKTTVIQADWLNDVDIATYGVLSYGAVGDGVADDTAALNAALAASKIVVIPAGVNLRITSNVVMPQGTSLVGQSRYDSKITLDGDIEGITIGRASELCNLRVIGNTSMTTDATGRAKACINLGTTAADSARSRISHVIAGGTYTLLGDSSTTRCTGAAIKTGNTFLNTVEDCYFHHADIGHEGKFVTGVTMNAVHWKQTEFQGCRIGQRAAVLNGVNFSMCTWEGNDEEGLILGAIRSAVIDQPYFEANNAQNTGAKKADLWIEGTVAVVGVADVGGSLVISGGYYAKGTNGLYGIYADSQRGISIRGGFFRDFTGATNIIYIGDTNTMGWDAFNFFGNTNVAPRFPSSLGLHGNYAYTGTARTGRMDLDRVLSKSGTTASLAGTSPGPAGTEDIFTPTAGETYLLHISNTSNNVNLRWVGIVQVHASTLMTITAHDSNGLTVANNAGAVQITNANAAAQTFSWVALRLR